MVINQQRRRDRGHVATSTAALRNRKCLSIEFIRYLHDELGFVLHDEL